MFYFLQFLRGLPLIAAVIMLMDLNRFWWRWWEHRTAAESVLAKLREEGAVVRLVGDSTWINVRFDIVPVWVDLVFFNILFPVAIIIGLALWGYDCRKRP